MCGAIAICTMLIYVGGASCDNKKIINVTFLRPQRRCRGRHAKVYVTSAN